MQRLLNQLPAIAGAPEVGDLSNVVDKGGVIEIPISAVDADGNPIEISVAGLPRFASFVQHSTQGPSTGNGTRSGVMRFAPGAGDRRDYTITVTATDDGEGNVNQVLSQNKSFVLTTYLVDLASIAAGTVVNLSFDLIGFGKGFDATNSRITIRDLRLGVPQTTDDELATTEDTTAEFNALANDLNAQQPGFTPIVIGGPAHGEVTINIDGSFRYVPQANWFGDDQFTYKLSDGVVASNLATVHVVVSPVNDAPVLADQTLVTDEDTVMSGNVLATATDLDGDALSAALGVGPTHGALQFAARISGTDHE